MPAYDPRSIEAKWQEYWEQNKSFRTPNISDKPKLYVLDMFPYPSGEGLHVGHPEGYSATDMYCRYKRMQGFNVLHPMGYDAFGLPAEQYAIETGTHPRITTERNITNIRRQIKRLGFSYDWDRSHRRTSSRKTHSRQVNKGSSVPLVPHFAPGPAARTAPSPSPDTTDSRLPIAKGLK